MKRTSWWPTGDVRGASYKESVQDEIEEFNGDWRGVLRYPMWFVDYPKPQVASLHEHILSVQTATPVALASGDIAVLNDVPFLLLSTDSMWRTWRAEHGYRAPGFGDCLLPHGWACAFKGDGHDRLVSRRWLEHGPWRLIRDEASDLSFVQFHDLEADAETALEQARPGHERMGIRDHGGFIQKRYVYEHELRGYYDADDRVMEIIVTGRPVSQCEMLDASAARHYQKFTAEGPVDNVRFVFTMGEDEARKHLHELWLRELECWAIVDGEKVRLDDTYEPPPPEKPAWVAEVEAREAAAE